MQRNTLPELAFARWAGSRHVQLGPGGRLAIAAALLTAAACSGPPSAAPPPSAPEVSILMLQATPVTLTRELPGRTSPYRLAEARARVSGVVQKRLFAEGSDAREGQILFRIDPAPYQTALDSARAQLARAEANAASARPPAERYAELVEAKAVSRQEYDDAIAARRGTEADVAAARAAVQTARINLSYTTVASPLSGRIGRAAVTEGAYAQQAQATLLATVQQLDPMYADLTRSSAEATRLRSELAAGRLRRTESGAARVKLVLEDGSEFTAFGGTSSSELTGLFGSGSGIWNFAPSVNLPIFSGGRNKAGLDAAEASKRIEIARYEKAIQVAFREVADKLAGQAMAAERIDAQTALVSADQRRYDLAEHRHRTGVDSYLAVLAAQQDLYRAQQTLIQAQQARLANLIQLYKALGGGWLEQSALTSPRASS